MDIFKKLTKGISFDPKSVPQRSVKPSASLKKNENDKIKDGGLGIPEELNFFSEIPVKKEKEEINDEYSVKSKSKTPQSSTDNEKKISKKTTCFKASFTSQEDLEEFKANHSIRLSLHQTSENSTNSNSSTASTLHHVTELLDQEQIAPVRSFAELVQYYAMDSRLLERLEEEATRETLQLEEINEKRSKLLLPSNGVEIKTIVTSPTAVQMQATPVILQGRDMIVMAPTGSGKTLAFILGIFGRLLKTTTTTTTISESGNVRALVISPTRELADQIHQQFLKFSPRASDNNKPLLRVAHLTKGVVNGWSVQRPASYPQILITTPLRLIHALKSNLLSIENLEILVLDEADRLLADGFDEQLDELLVAMKTPAKVQKALFSATMPSGVEATARTILTAPYRIVCGSTNPNGSTLQSIDQKLIFCGNGSNSNSNSKSKLNLKNKNNDKSELQHDESVGKLMALRQLIHQGSLTPPVLIFVGSATRAERLFSDLIKWSAAALNRPLPIDYLHAGRSQSERSSVLEAFRSGKIWFLITTDVLARGLDFPPLSAVINYDFPDSTASYIHRIGRTGRAGRFGTSYTFYTTDDLPDLRIVVNVMRESGIEVQQWLQDHYTKSQGTSRLSKKLKFKENSIKKAKTEKNDKEVEDN